jgi:hypothetical protein
MNNGVPISLNNMAQACEVDGFNWQQQVVARPAPSDPSWCDFTSKTGITTTSGKPINLCIYANSSNPDPYHPTTPLIAPYYDPPLGGYTYELLLPPFFSEPSYPFFCMPPDTVCPETTYSLGFGDLPKDPALNPDIINSFPPSVIPTGFAMEFQTQLVGVKGGLPVRVFYPWTWQSTFNGSTGGVGTTKSLLGADPPGGTGGITITSINGVPQTPPSVSCAATPNTLWPPNGQLVSATISGIVVPGTQAIPSVGTTYAVVDEYGQVQPSGSFVLGTGGSYSLGMPLVAARNGDDRDGRTYTITVMARDKVGNLGSCSAVVTVPHDQRD